MSDNLSSEAEPQRLKAKRGLAPVVFGLSFVAPVALLGTMMATNVGVFSYELGFRTLALGVIPKLAIAVAVISVLSLLISLFKNPKKYGLWALGAVVVSGLMLAGCYTYDLRLKTLPPIYDVATNWERPVTFSAKLLEARGPQSHPVIDNPVVPDNQVDQWAGRRVADINKQTCAGAVTVPGRAPVEKVVEILKNEGYVVFGRSDWRVEAFYEDPYFGFKSDVVVRMEPNGTDVRSVSRLEPVDLGGNCKRVTKLVKLISAL
ncbi:MAG: DUF1499 domain-containing protein [Asticcacaulis sp.]